LPVEHELLEAVQPGRVRGEDLDDEAGVLAIVGLAIAGIARDENIRVIENVTLRGPYSDLHVRGEHLAAVRQALRQEAGEIERDQSVPVARPDDRIDLAVHVFVTNLALQLPCEVLVDGQGGRGRLGLHRSLPLARVRCARPSSIVKVR